MPRWDNAPQAHSWVSNINFDIWKQIVDGVSINIPWQIYQGRHSSCPRWAQIKGSARALNWLKCLGGIMHLKPTAWCQISTLIFWFGRGDPIHIPWTNTEGWQNSLPLEVYVKGIFRALNWLKCLGGIMHLKPTAGCQISTLIYLDLGWPYAYPMPYYRRTAKFFATWRLGQRYYPGL